MILSYSTDRSTAEYIQHCTVAQQSTSTDKSQGLGSEPMCRKSDAQAEYGSLAIKQYLTLATFWGSNPCASKNGFSMSNHSESVCGLRCEPDRLNDWSPMFQALICGWQPSRDSIRGHTAVPLNLAFVKKGFESLCRRHGSSMSDLPEDARRL